MKLRPKTASLLLVLAGSCAAAGATMAMPPQATVVGDLPLSYVPLDATGQKPCPVATTTPAPLERFPNMLLVGDWILRTDKGTTRCALRTTDAAYCTFGSPEYLVVELNGVPIIYEIPKGSRAELEIRDGRHACRIGPRIRTHGDTIVPNL